MAIRVRLSANKMPFSWIIRAFTWDRHSHCDFLFEDGTYLGALCFPGVCIHELAESTEDFYEWSGTPEQEAAIIKYAKAQIGKKYDWSGVFGFLMHRNWAEDDKWFCSELIAGAFHAAGVKLFDESANKISPRDIAINVMFKKIDKPKHAK